MKKYNFRAKLTDALIKILPWEERNIVNISKRLLEIQEDEEKKSVTENRLEQRAENFGFTYRIVSENTIKSALYPANIKAGCSPDKFCSLSTLIIFALGPHSQYNHPLDLLDGTSQDHADLNSYMSSMEIKRPIVGQSACDDDIDLKIYNTSLEHEFTWIAQSQQSLYGKVDAVDREKYQEWYHANPSGFFIFYYEGEIIGHLTLLPFKEEHFLPYKQGLIREKSLMGDAIWKTEERDKITSLYVESYILVDKYTRIAAPRIRASFIDMARNVANLNSIEAIYAMDATIRGINTIRGMGFKPVEPPIGARMDGHTMHRASIEDIEKNSLVKAAIFVLGRTREFLIDLRTIDERTKSLGVDHDIRIRYNRVMERLMTIARMEAPSRKLTGDSLNALDDILVKMRFGKSVWDFLGVLNFYNHCKTD